MNKGTVTVVTIAALAVIVTIVILGVSMNKQSHKMTLTQYAGVGSGVLKHGTIVQVENGQPVVIGHFDDQSGKTWPGTWEIKK